VRGIGTPAIVPGFLHAAGNNALPKSHQGKAAPGDGHL
jgi:hypothetical protein